MTNAHPVYCDSCGEIASPEHTARRLQRLEWSTRYRPVHIGTIFLGGTQPPSDSEFLYAPSTEFRGEAGKLLEAVELIWQGKRIEQVLAEFQRGGFFLAHVLDCPLEAHTDSMGCDALMQKRAPQLIARIRRSLKPKRIVVISDVNRDVVRALRGSDLGCTILLDGETPFSLDGRSDAAVNHRLREALSAELPHPR